MTITITVDKDTRDIDSMYLASVKTADLPFFFNYDNIAIIEIDPNRVTFLNPYNGSIDWAVTAVAKSGHRKVIYDIDNKTILYDFVTKKLISYNGFTGCPKNSANEIILLRDSKEKLWKSCSSNGLPLLAQSISYSSRMNSRVMSDFGKSLYMGLMREIYGITNTNNIDYYFEPLPENITEIKIKNMEVLLKIIEKVPKVKREEIKFEDMDIGVFLALDVLPKTNIRIIDSMKIFSPLITEIILTTGDTLTLYYASTQPPALSAPQIRGMLNLSNEVTIRILPEYRLDDYDDYDDVPLTWRM